MKVPAPLLAAALAVTLSGAADAQHATPNPLLTLDQHRSSVVQRLLDEWSDAALALPAERRMDRERLGSALWSLRSDRLLAASFAGSFGTIEALLAESRVEAAATPGATRATAKSVGDVGADLAYTPLTPCRIADTRNAGGALQANTTRTLDGHAASSFAAQGGAASTCGIPSDVAALAMNVYAVNPTTLGFIKVWPANAAEPAVSTVNYQVGITAIATGTIVPVDGANTNRFSAKSPAAVDLIVDVVGYFKRPANYLGTHTITGVGASDGGGQNNAVSGNYATVAGGINNTASALYAVVGGGAGNSATKDAATVAGGAANTATNFDSTVGGGAVNNATGNASTVAGGYSNNAGGLNAAIGGGTGNAASGQGSTVVGGESNSAGNVWATALGGSGNHANGKGATVVGGLGNTAGGEYSVAMGVAANSGGRGCFIFSDASSASATNCSDYTFVARATGGVTFITSGTSQANYNGLYVPAGGGSWVVFSDRNGKEDFAPVDGVDVLDRLARMPVTTWSWKAERGTARHMGPMAQDFREAFALGYDERGIATVDEIGVAIAAIQGLHTLLRDRDARIDAQAREIDLLKLRFDALHGAR